MGISCVGRDPIASAHAEPAKRSFHFEMYTSAREIRSRYNPNKKKNCPPVLAASKNLARVNSQGKGDINPTKKIAGDINQVERFEKNRFHIQTSNKA